MENIETVSGIVEGLAGVASAFGWIPAAALAPIVLLGGAIANLFSDKEEKETDKNDSNS